MDPVYDRAPKGDGQHLHPAADPQDRLAPLAHRLDEVELEPIAGVVDRVRLLGVATV
jgi:hypothetical protein